MCLFKTIKHFIHLGMLFPSLKLGNFSCFFISIYVLVVSLLKSPNYCSALRKSDVFQARITTVTSGNVLGWSFKFLHVCFCKTEFLCVV